MKIDAKMEAKRHHKSPKIWLLGAHGSIFMDFGRFWKTMKFHYFFNQPCVAKNPEKMELEAPVGGGIHAPGTTLRNVWGPF